ncbi:DUF2752 domain-containing protein [Flavobacterium sp. CYK-4]|uniref:DUF2752 domain-containing protein n=1 Tax=Flavobacterium lotistagni TaxID=2709660 RepID=UPI00140AFCA9|nr:DUF2752 domain-containing protein [Flavobacterium lotistagni]NHM07091.1 DUF2752 domain-containing protein [Flavobacterium lotistagni]
MKTLILDLQRYMIPCLNKKLFGIDCPGCGTQRAILQLINGNFSAAFHQFPAIYTTILLFGFLALHYIDKSRNYHKIIISLAVINAMIMIVAYIYKMTL